MKYTTRIEIKERHTGADLIGADLRNTRLQNANIENSFLPQHSLFNVGIDFIKRCKRDQRKDTAAELGQCAHTDETRRTCGNKD